MGVEERQAHLHGFATLAFAGRIAFGQVLVFVRSARWFEGVLDEIVCDSGALEIERVRGFLSLGQGQVADGGVSADFIRDVGGHGVAGGGPCRRLLCPLKGRSDYRASGLVGWLHALKKKQLLYRQPLSTQRIEPVRRLPRWLVSLE